MDIHFSEFGVIEVFFWFCFLQPFFVLHTAFSEKSDKKSSGRGKNKRRIDLSPVSPRKSLKRRAEISKDGAHDYFMDLRLEAFNFVWSQIELSIKVLFSYPYKFAFFPHLLCINVKGNHNCFTFQILRI